MGTENVISMADKVAADHNNRETIRDYLSHRDGIRAFRGTPDGRDVGAVERSDSDIMQGIGEELSSLLRTGGQLENLDRDTYDAWLKAVDGEHKVSLVGFDAKEFAQKLEDDAARAAKWEKYRTQSVASQADGDDGQAKVRELRAAMRNADQGPEQKGGVAGWLQQSLSRLRAIGSGGPSNEDTHDNG